MILKAGDVSSSTRWRRMPVVESITKKSCAGGTTPQMRRKRRARNQDRVKILFHASDFVEAAVVATAEIVGSQESLHHFDGGLGADDAATEGQDVGIVVFAGETRGHHVMGQGGANARHFVGGDGN